MTAVSRFWSDMNLVTRMSYVLHVENVFFTHIMLKGDVNICIKIMAVVLGTLVYIH
jgi:hypothetical protein